MGQGGTHKVVFADRFRPEDSFDVTGLLSEEEAEAVARERSGGGVDFGVYRVVRVIPVSLVDAAAFR